MEDENGIELSLGLGCGGSSAKSKGKNGCSSDAKLEESDKGNKRVDDFKNFLHACSQKQDLSAGSQIGDSVKPQENFFSDLSKAKADADADALINLKNRGLWGSSSSRPAEIEEEKGQELGNKRNLLFDEMNNQKRHERDPYHSDAHDKKASHISVTEDGSTAENEDVAESEVEGSTSRLVSNPDDASKRFVGLGGPSEVRKEVCGFSHSDVVDWQGPKRPNGSSETEIKHGNLNYGVPLSIRPINIMKLPYSFPTKESDSVGLPNTSGHPLPGMMQVMPTSNGEQQTGTHSVSPGNFPVMFGYSPVQLPTLDKDNSWGLVSHLQPFHPSYAGRVPSNLDKQNDGLKIAPGMHVISRNSSESALCYGRTSDRVKGDGKQHITEEGSASQPQDEAQGGNTTLRSKDASGPSTADGLSSDFSAIKPGIHASDLKFGGCGSYPNLPWVSATGSGPNGRTISGVTYRYSANQIRIVCACHGSHMSPDEFVRHASEENVNPENGSGLAASFPSTNPAASAQS